MIRFVIAAMSVPLALAGCAATSRMGSGTAGGAANGSVIAGPVETIRYATTACHGFCPVYTVTVSSDGKGVFAGEQHVAALGEHRFTVSPAQFADFRQRLTPFRPATEAIYQPDGPLCGPAATDLSSVDVRWTQPGRASSHLDLYYGCGGEAARAMRDGLRAAPEALPLAALIGAR